jgi:hypothetical protein
VAEQVVAIEPEVGDDLTELLDEAFGHPERWIIWPLGAAAAELVVEDDRSLGAEAG